MARIPKFHRWNVSSKQIELLWLIEKNKDTGIKRRREKSKIIWKEHLKLPYPIPKKLRKRVHIRNDIHFYSDESNFNKAIKSLMDKDLISRKKEKIGNIEKYGYYLTKKGKMFLKIIS